MKKQLLAVTAFALAAGLTACGGNGGQKAESQTQKTESQAAEATQEETKAEKESREETSKEAEETKAEAGAKEPFQAEYEVEGSSYTGPFRDTYVFEGETTDGIITSLNFDVIRDKGTEKEYSKKDIMGYVMNISDGAVEKSGEGLKLTLGCNGYDTRFGDGNSAQFMLSASTENLTEETTFQDLNFFNTAYQAPCPLEQALIAYQYLAAENGIETLTGDTPVKDLLRKHGLYNGTAFQEGKSRISFAGFNGGRSYGEQLDAITDYILANSMTLEDVYEMFKTENQQSTPIEDRDTISGATISFTGDFQNMAYLAMTGELPEGVVSHIAGDGTTDVEVLTQGFGGEITTIVTFDAEGAVTKITVKSASETEGIGAKLTAEDSEYIQALIAGQS
ncbi:MAG: FMN-binding protein, partial [Lachnospiraceae bacterium]|nr:FMN-binding protein [Lachnospiraceae bacterium]